VEKTDSDAAGQLTAGGLVAIMAEKGGAAMVEHFEKMGLRPFGAAPAERHMEWYRRRKTAFLHFGPNTFTDREWGDGRESAEIFAPSELDCRQWAKVLREGGFDAAILTAKHHDGFCLWPSAYTEHSVKRSPGAPDVVGKFVAACREFGIKPGLYISPWDRNHPSWGTDKYNDIYAGQLTELMTLYGEIWECWWDGAGSAEARYDWKRWAEIVRNNQPQCVLFGCLGAAEYVDVRWVGNERGIAGENCWGTIEPGIIVDEICAALNSGSPDGSRFIPAETNTSIRPGWFYHASQDGQVKQGETLMDYWFRSAGRNTAILLNLPPDRRGLIHEEDARAVKEWNDRLEAVFAENLAAKGRITPGWEPLLKADFDAVRASDTLLPEIRIDFPEEIVFDCILLREVIELGHRIRGFRAEALTEGGWQLLLEGKCMGFCRGERFPEISAKAVRLTVTEAAALPVLRSIGLYRGAAPVTARENAPKEPPIAQTQDWGHTIEIALEGIYSYDRVELSPAPEGSWQVHSFNGTRYEQTAEAVGESCDFSPVTGSYRLKLTSDAFLPDTRVKVIYTKGK